MKTEYPYLQTMLTTAGAKKMSREDLMKLQNERLMRLIRHARENSAYYREKYAGLPDEPELSSLPPVTKRALMSRFGDWITDPSVKWDDLQHFIQNTDTIGRLFLEKYLVSTTSGSTGIPTVCLYDKNSLNVLDALALTRSMAYKGIMGKLVRAGGRSAAVYATGGHYLGVASTRYKQHKNPLKAKQFAIFSVLRPVEELVSNLNRFKPALLGGYPTALELLIPEKLSGRLSISPVLINTGGEYLSKELARRLSEAFGCPVQSGYSCTEGGLISFQCREGHYHVNEDWVIVEPVDADGKPVPPGTLSEKILLTNLANFVQPVIRYEVTDRVRVLDSPCPCGNPLTAIEVEGRTDDILEFDGGSVRIPPLAVYVVLKEIHNVVRFQVIQKAGGDIDLRLETAGDRDATAREAVRKLDAFFREKGVQPTITLSERLPSPDSSGKFRHILRVR